MRIRHVQSEDDLRQAADLVAQAFASPNDPYGRIYEHMLKDVPRDPTYRPENLRLVEVDGRIVSHVMVVDRVVRVGGAALRMGGISGVTTHSAHRRRGYMRALMEDCLAYMERQGYDISLLDGIPDFYHRFGYVPVMPEYTLRIPAAEAEKLAQPLRVRRYKRSDLPALMALYRADNDRRTGTVVRTEAYWRWRLKRLRHCWVAVDEQGAVRGYVWLAEPPGFRVIEAAGDGPGVVESLLRFLARRAKAGYAAEIPLGLPPDHPFARRALALCGGEATMRVARNGGWMGRFIGLRGSFERLAGELGERLCRSAFKDWRGTLRLATNLGTVELHVAESDEVAVRGETGGRAVVCALPQTALIQLLFGYRDAAEVAANPDVAIPEEALPLLRALFPPGHPFIAEPDYF